MTRIKKLTRETVETVTSRVSLAGGTRPGRNVDGAPSSSRSMWQTHHGRIPIAAGMERHKRSRSPHRATTTDPGHTVDIGHHGALASGSLSPFFQARPGSP